MRTKAGQEAQFGICLDNRGYTASLEVGKLYRVIPDAQASKHRYLRVVDESGEDYGYAAERFFVLTVPRPIARALSGRAGRRARGPKKALEPAIRRVRRV